MSDNRLRQQYDHDGYAVFREVLDEDLVGVANEHIDWLLARHPELRPDQLGHQLARTDPFWHRLVSDPRLVDIAEIFLGEDVAVFATHYICKEPITGRQVLWHQDGAFWPLDPVNVITLWVALTDSRRDNGCVKVVPGSHKTNLLDMVDSTEDAVLPSEIPVEVDEKDAFAFELEPGDVSVHHPNIFHGSDANTSTRWRRGLTIRFIPTSVKITDPDAASPILVRGHAVDDLNEYLPTPSLDPEHHMSFTV
ncbi:MAG: phytanoyl-CoA dioxygenase family protein [Acidimicrobiia bacterium]|nr:phytanoyl-CoA dioxygenase family protein [Acidimicrobiia bacterium]